MATFTSTRTAPADMMLRVQEIEAVLQGVLDKLATLTSPETPELTEVNEALDRLFNLLGFGARTDNMSSDPRAETIYDTSESSVSYLLFGLAEDDMRDRLIAILTGSGSRPIMETLYDITDDRWFSTSATLAGVTYGDATQDYVTTINARSNGSLAAYTFGSTDMLELIAGDFAPTPDHSLAYSVFGSTDMLSALGGNSIAYLSFGSPTRAGAWQAVSVSLAEAIYGDDVPTITSDPLVAQIAALRAQLADHESRLEALEA
ncbi:hypothetical protein ABIA16_003537 [Sinorhizobium fredii]